MNGLDLFEPLLPLAAASRGDAGRIVLGTALPYAALAGAFALKPYDRRTLPEIARVHAEKHFLSDVFLGAAIGAFTMQMFYSWSLTREESGRGWLDHASVACEPGTGEVGIELAWSF